jgi:hypothetical protein
VAERGKARRQRRQPGAVDVPAGAVREQDGHTLAGRDTRIDD